LSFINDKDDERRTRREPPAEVDAAAPSRSRSRTKHPENPELGKALRTVYQRTIEEDIPPEMLDLLGKLG
jgi:hypothetical protein